MMGACHERVQRVLDLLGRLRDHVARHEVDHEARQAARDGMRYFDVAAPQHHRDEERHVFPLLEAHGDAAMQRRCGCAEAQSPDQSSATFGLTLQAVATARRPSSS